MCGNVGIFGKPPKKKELIEFLLILDSTRGTDGTGCYMASINKGKNLIRERLLKQAGPVFDLIENKKWEKHTFEADLYIGHNRATSTGVNSRDNTHPFEFSKIVGAHNGTLTGWYSNDYPLQDNVNMDSQWIYYYMSKYGFPQTANKMMGSWSCVWFDKEECSLHFWRNKERPLFILKNDDYIVWASEPWMLEAAIVKFSLKGEITSNKELVHYTWALDEKDKPVLIDEVEVRGRITYPKVPSTGATVLTTTSKGTGVSRTKTSYHRSYPTYNRYLKTKRESKGFECAYCSAKGIPAEKIGYRFQDASANWWYVCKECDEEWAKDTYY